MKKYMAFIVVIGVVFALHGCTAYELQLRISGAKMLNQSDLEQLFYADRTVKFSIPSGLATVRYYPDGRQEIEWDNGQDTGHFRIENDEFCSTWRRLRNSAESCSKIYRVSEEKYEFISNDGTLAATMYLK
jgi:hypothetical protein